MADGPILAGWEMLKMALMCDATRRKEFDRFCVLISFAFRWHFCFLVSFFCLEEAVLLDCTGGMLVWEDSIESSFFATTN